MTERIPLAVEGVPTGDGRLLLPGALRWPDEGVSVTLNVPKEGGPSLSEVVGHADNFGRVDGVISADVSLFAGWERSIRNHSAQISVHHVHRTEADGLLRIHRCDLVNVHLMPGFTNAWPQLDHRLLEEGDQRQPPWERALLDYLHERTDRLDFKGNDIPNRLADLLEHGIGGDPHA